MSCSAHYTTQTPIGYVIGGSIQQGIIAKLHHSNTQEYGIGSFVVIALRDITLFCSLADITLAVPPHILHEYDERLEHLLHSVHHHACHTTALIHPLWAIKSSSITRAHHIPPCFSPVYKADPRDITNVWHAPFAHDTHFAIGTFGETSSEVTVPLKHFVSRSNAVFGKTGTGKTFITRYLLAGILAHRAATLLIFDMHNEYASYARQEHTKQHAEGLKTLFPQLVFVATLDQRKKNSGCDTVIRIPLTMIHVEDVLALQRELALHPTACEAAYLLFARFSNRWLSVLLERETELAELAQEVGAHAESISALHRKLKRIAALPFMCSEETQALNSLQAIVTSLEQGTSVIIEFGSCNQTVGYLLVANILTRMLYEAYIRKTERFIAQKDGIEPKQVVIVIEEAHKFLHPHLASQTPFGMIAREMRKYYVSLFIIDQRPSHIDDEILSQLGTKFILQLSDGSDCDAALYGIEKSTHVRALLETISAKQQLIMAGHSAPFATKVHVYHYASLTQRLNQVSAPLNTEKILADLFGS